MLAGPADATRWSWQRNRVGVACRCAPRPSFQSQRLQLQEQLLDVLTADSTASGRVEQAARLVLLAKASIQQSPDYLQFQRCWRQAEKQHNQQPAARRGSPARLQAAAAATTGSSSSEIVGDGSAPAAAPWSWQHVSSLVVYGLGSLGAYVPALQSGSKQRKECTRAVSTLHQLALALLLQEQLPGLAGAPQAYDPAAFNDLDRQLLQRLGFQVLGHNERCARRAEQPTLFYMPCCPRWLAHNLLAANWQHPEQLEKVAVLGNSFKAQASSGMLLAALAGAGRPGSAAAGGGGMGMLAQMAGAAQQGADDDGPADPSYDAGSDRAVLLSDAGAVNEVFCPDMNVHGVAHSIHTFPQPLLRARAAHLF